MYSPDTDFAPNTYKTLGMKEISKLIKAIVNNHRAFSKVTTVDCSNKIK